MRKLKRSIIRHQVYLYGGGIEMFRYLWKLSKKQSTKQQKKSQYKSQITVTGEKYKKQSFWDKINSFISRIAGKSK